MNSRIAKQISEQSSVYYVPCIISQTYFWGQLRSQELRTRYETSAVLKNIDVNGWR